MNLLDYDRIELRALFSSIGEKPFRADQIIKWVHQRGVTDFGAMTNLSKNLRALLSDTYRIVLPSIEQKQVSRDGTTKWLIRVDQKNCVEMVFIPEGDRGTLCVSSQAGCALNCSFCATAQQGFGMNLSLSQIIGQVWLAAQELGQNSATSKRITNVVMMGMGEPLLNTESVFPALRLMLDDDTYNLARKKVTLSTAGVVPGIDKLAIECPVSLAVSLHSADDQIRDEIVPINKKYPISSLLESCRRYILCNPHDKITFEYVMLKGVNDTVGMARRLIQILRGIPAKVNLIPFNPFPNSKYECSCPETIEKFKGQLLSSGILTVTRKTRGQDIDAACGQLAGKIHARAARHRIKRN
jgi:23S rRNA (adenine2503-C2)-methyltransferase